MAKKKEETAVQERNLTVSQRFSNMVMREFASTVGKLQVDPYQMKLAQHLFVAIDNSLRTLETKRLDGGKQGTPITWQNVNMQKLALDAVHRIELGLDALIPAHLYTIPYMNKRLGKYDVDLRVGYKGEDFYYREMALDPPVDIIYELVHETDTFKPIKKSALCEVESYEFEQNEPFNRGKVIGGFGYIQYQDPRKNKLVIVSQEDFAKSRKKAMSDQFWKDYEKEMQYKTLVHRTVKHIPLDPRKINASFHTVETDNAIVMNEREIDENANQGYIDIQPETDPPQEPTPPLQAKTQGAKKEPTAEKTLRCPEEIDPEQHEKPVSECRKCPHRMNCNPYTELLIEEEQSRSTSKKANENENEPEF
jgi:recombination protein RecT